MAPRADEGEIFSQMQDKFSCKENTHRPSNAPNQAVPKSFYCRRECAGHCDPVSRLPVGLTNTFPHLPGVFLADPPSAARPRGNCLAQGHTGFWEQLHPLTEPPGTTLKGPSASGRPVESSPGLHGDGVTVQLLPPPWHTSFPPCPTPVPGCGPSKHFLKASYTLSQCQGLLPREPSLQQRRVS